MDIQECDNSMIFSHSIPTILCSNKCIVTGVLLKINDEMGNHKRRKLQQNIALTTQAKTSTLS